MEHLGDGRAAAVSGRPLDDELSTPVFYSWLQRRISAQVFVSTIRETGK
jgi:hypothetical protein